MTTAQTKKAVLEGILVRLTFDGAFQRSKIYSKNISDDMRKEFRNFMAALLPKYLKKIQRIKKYNDSDHYKTIKAFAGEVTRKHRNILDKNRLRIGNAQKFLNLYWKVSWLLKKGTARPIHCPFDSVIMKELPKNVRVSWTKFDSIKEYRILVEAVQDMIGKVKSIAEWEMKIYLEQVNYIDIFPGESR